MPALKIRRLNKLPAIPEANSLYVIKGTSTGEASLYFTGNSPSEIRHTITRTEVADMIATAIEDAGILNVAELPPVTPDMAGTLVCLTSNNNIPCWCNGIEWIDLSKDVYTGGTGSIDGALVKKLRNHLYFDIKLV